MNNVKKPRKEKAMDVDDDEGLDNISRDEDTAVGN